VKLTIIHNSNRDAIVHAAGCADIKRRELRDRAYLSHWDADHASQQDAANDAWADFIAEESMTEADALGYTHFLPCVGDLPETAPAETGPLTDAERAAVIADGADPDAVEAIVAGVEGWTR
jgi:hypothetical protein